MFSMVGCVLFGQKAEPALHIFCHSIIIFSLRIWNDAFNWLGVCVSIPATLFELFIQFSRCACDKKEKKIRSLIWIVVIRSI